MYRFNIPYELQDDDQLCFVHINKTAGCTVGDELIQHFPANRVFKDLSRKMDAMMALPLYVRKAYQLVWMHNYYPELRAIQPGKQIYTTMLRHPVERVISMYYYILSRPEHRLYSETTARSLEEFLLWDGQYESHDLQTRRLTGITDLTQDPDADLACTLLRDKFIFVGLVQLRGSR